MINQNMSIDSILKKFAEYTTVLSQIERDPSKKDSVPNIYVNEKGVVFKKDVEDGNHDFARLWTAPEVGGEKWEFTKASLRMADIWSLGLVMVSLCVPNMRPILTCHSIKQIEKDVQENEQNLSKVYGQELAALLHGLLSTVPELRPSFEEIKSQLTNLQKSLAK